MRDLRVNYVIATYADASKRPRVGGDPPFVDYLKIHLESLKRAQLRPHDQITIMRAEVDTTADSAVVNEFYTRGFAVADLPCPVIVHNTQNIAMSYGQWMKAWSLYGKSFDYYVLAEDDYYVDSDRFRPQILEAYSRARAITGLGSLYLSTMVWSGDLPKFHSGISNGIVDAASFGRATCDPRNIAKGVASPYPAQYNFSRLFQELAGVSDEFTAAFWDGTLRTYSRSEKAPSQALWRPVQHTADAVYTHTRIPQEDGLIEHA